MIKRLPLLLALALAALLPASRVRAQDAPPVDAFRPGDRVLLSVDGERTLSDTFTVVTGPAIVLPAIGTVSLAGIHRGDITPYLATTLGRYLRHPVVHARALLRVEVVGEVLRPGFYAMPTDALLSDAMMEAGGLTRDAKFASLSIARQDSVIWEGDRLQSAIVHGRTLDELGLQSGDALIVPRRHDPESTARIVGILVTLPVAVYGITRLF